MCISLSQKNTLHIYIVVDAIHPYGCMYTHIALANILQVANYSVKCLISINLKVKYHILYGIAISLLEGLFKA